MRVRQFNKRRFTRETPALYSKVELYNYDPEKEQRTTLLPYEELRYDYAPSRTNAVYLMDMRIEETLNRRHNRLLRLCRPAAWKYIKDYEAAQQAFSRGEGPQPAELNQDRIRLPYWFSTPRDARYWWNEKKRTGKEPWPVRDITFNAPPAGTRTTDC